LLRTRGLLVVVPVPAVCLLLPAAAVAVALLSTLADSLRPLLCCFTAVIAGDAGASVDSAAVIVAAAAVDAAVAAATADFTVSLTTISAAVSSVAHDCGLLWQFSSMTASIDIDLFNR
jgi:hypothetical protein